MWDLNIIACLRYMILDIPRTKLFPTTAKCFHKYAATMQDLRWIGPDRQPGKEDQRRLRVFYKDKCLIYQKDSWHVKVFIFHLVMIPHPPCRILPVIINTDVLLPGFILVLNIVHNTFSRI